MYISRPDDRTPEVVQRQRTKTLAMHSSWLDSAGVQFQVVQRMAVVWKSEGWFATSALPRKPWKAKVYAEKKNGDDIFSYACFVQ